MGPTQLDEYFLQLINHAGESPLADAVFVGFTILGMLVVLLLAAPIIYARGKRETAFDLVVCVIVASVVVELIKLVVDRDRPYAALDGAVQTISFYGLAETTGPSFPSGHAGRVFAVAALLSLNSGLGARAAAFTLAFMVALSRVFLGLHWPSDILVGAVLGVVLALGIAYLGRAWRPYRDLRKRTLRLLARAFSPARPHAHAQTRASARACGHLEAFDRTFVP